VNPSPVPGVRLGMLTPSSNTVLEPVTTAMLAGVPEASVHFSRFRVTEIALDARALGQFDDSEILRAAELLAHARVGVIGWSGTSASWLGLDRDRRLVQRIREATGVAACTSVLALQDILRATGARRLGLVTPYLDEVQKRIVSHFAAEGIDVVAERHLDLRDNFSFSQVDAATLRRLVLEVADARPDAIAILCTNLRGGPLVAELEAQAGVPVHDSVATTLWAALRHVGVDTRRVRGWGRLFEIGELP
jgi:maleate isomerase